MSRDSLPPANCGNPHHPEMARRACNAEIAAWHLKGWAILMSGLAESRRTSDFGRIGDEAVGMVVSHALFDLAESLEARPEKASRRCRPAVPPDDNARWLRRRLTDLQTPGPDGRPA